MSKNELVIVVDHQDNILGFKPRHLLEHNDRYRSTSIWIENSNGDILLAKRHPSKQHYPNLWGPAASGTVGHLETYSANAHKELQEELGIAQLPLIEIKRGAIDHIDGSQRFSVWYMGLLDLPISSLNPHPDEITEVRWVTKNKLLDELYAQSDNFIPSSVYWAKLFLGQ